MARAGVCSRREAEAWIVEGRVSVNGEVLKSPAFNVSDADDVRVDGKRLAAPERTRLFLFHKPRGLVTTARDPEGRATVFAALPPDLPRVVAIGRLDINTEGLLLLTNDGGLARVLELPSTGWLRRYRVRAHGSIDQAALDRLSEGVTIDGVDYLGVEAKLDREQGANAWLTLGLREGKNREIKKILEHLGLAVNRLIRISFGPFELGDLPEREVMEVRTRVLRDQLGVKLAKEAGANFDARADRRDEPPPERRPGERPRESRGPREARGRGPAKPGRPDRGAGGREPVRTGRPAAPRAAETVHAGAPAQACLGLARGNRRGRRDGTAQANRARRDPRPQGANDRGRAHVPGWRGGARAPRPRRGRSAQGVRTLASAARTRVRNTRDPRNSFGPKRRQAGRPAGANGRRVRTRRRPDAGPRGRTPRGRRAPRERRFDRPAARSAGDRHERPSRTRDGGERPRERKFDRPPGRPRAQAGEGRPPRSDDKNRGRASAASSAPQREADGDRHERPSRTRDGARSGARAQV